MAGWFLSPYFIQCLFHLLLFHFPSHSSTLLPLCNHDDNYALLKFKNSFALSTSASVFGCSSSSKTSSWKNGTDCCQWDGVTCNTMTGHVIGLDLSCSNLQGEFHPNGTIFQLTHLQQLNLAFNDFSGSSISFEIGDLVNLTHLNLSHSALDGDIPSTISHLSKLVSLDLSYLYMVRIEPSTWNNLVLNATNLRELLLHDVDMSSIRESSLSLLMNLSSSLVSLGLDDTLLQWSFPSSILCLPNLQELSLSHNAELTGQLPKYNWSTPLRYLDLSVTSFSGEIPNSIGHLKSLNHLRLSLCEFHGLIPLSLWNHTQLSVLDLSINKLVGPIPSNITKLSQIETLNLNDNFLNGTIPQWCYSLPSLVDLELQYNQLTGSISEFSAYSLEWLFLSDNKLKGNFPNSIFKLKNLTGLSLSSTDLSGRVDFHQFSKFKNLKRLDLSSNSFLSINFDNNVDYISPNLQILSLSSCNITDFPKFLALVKNLVTLDLSHNKIHGKIPTWFNKKLLLSWTNFVYIDLSFNELQGDLPIPPHATYFFSISNNNLTGDISSTMCNASSLEVLNLSHNNLTGMIPQCLGTIHPLSVLDLQMNNLYGSIPRNFPKGNEFDTIKLNGNQLEGPLPQSLAHCTYLEVLDLGNNNIVDIFPSWLETLPMLQVLSLRENKFRGIINCDNTKHLFPKLRIFDVSNNNFSGRFPVSCIKNFQGMMNVNESQIGLKYMESDDSSYNDSVVITEKGQYRELVRILTAFTAIDLSNNMFEGKIPEVIGELISLKGLNLSHNRITGAIPQSLSNLRHLEWLDLSCNQLTGEIPMALTNLNFLSVLNLSQNQLEGIIPTGGQFNTFQNDSYRGNPMLCGFPLSKLCGKNEEWPPLSTFHHKEKSLFGWKVVAVGYACGVVFGILLGYNVILTGKPKWLARLVEGMFIVRVQRTNNRAPANHRAMNN